MSTRMSNGPSITRDREMSEQGLAIAPDKRASSDQPIAGEKPTSRYLCACPDLDYFRIADSSETIRKTPRLG